MGEVVFPAMVLPNDCYIGDCVLLEPIASALAYSQRSYVVSNWPMLFDGHPHIIGIRSSEEIPSNVLWVSLNLHNAITSTVPGEKGSMLVQPDKLERMYKAAGLSIGRITAPRLYLTPAEKIKATEMKAFFKPPLVGVVLQSRHRVKNWNGVSKFIKKGLKEGWSIFLIDESKEGAGLIAQEKGVFRIFGKNLRELMIALSVMDIVIGPDTGPVQMAAALKIPTVVVLYEIFKDLYQVYPESTPILVRNSPQYDGIKTVAVSGVLNAVRGKLEQMSRSDPTYSKIGSNHCVVRFRGLGDVLMSLIPLATIRSLNGDSKVTYVTSPEAAKLVELSGLCDGVIQMRYRHATSGLPPLPEGLDFTRYDSVSNMINNIDFCPESFTTPRPELFAREMGLDKIDSAVTNWHFKVPQSWKDESDELLRKSGVNAADKIIVLQADSEGASRQWPIERQREFCGYAHNRGYAVVVLSDKENRKYPSCAVNLTGKTSIEQYVGIISLAHCLVGSDSSGIHIAGFLGVPALGLFGSVDPDLRIANYDTVFALVGKGKCVPCNDWQRASCAGKKKVPACMWSLKAKRVFDEARKAIKAVERLNEEKQREAAGFAEDNKIEEGRISQAYSSLEAP